MNQVATRMLVLSGVLFWAIVAREGIDYWIFRGERPPERVETLSDFLSWHSTPTGASRVTVRGTTYFVIEGNDGRWSPSGPAAYTFDRSGNFVEWSVDCGDIESPRVVYSRESKEERMSVEDIMRSVESYRPGEPAAN